MNEKKVKEIIEWARLSYPDGSFEHDIDKLVKQICRLFRKSPDNPEGDDEVMAKGKCPHKLQGKLIEIPGKDGKMWGTPGYEPDYDKLEAIAHKMATGEGPNYCYLEFVYCNDCGNILEINQVFTDGEVVEKVYAKTASIKDAECDARFHNAAIMYLEKIDKLWDSYAEKLSEKEAECKKRVDGIVKEADRLLLPSVYDSSPKRLEWQALKKQEIGKLE